MAAQPNAQPIALPAQLTADQANGLLDGLRQQIAAAAGEEVVLDASGLQDFDSAALAALLECRRQAQALGKRLRVQGLPPGMASIAGLYGVDGLLAGQ